ncbi:MAG: sulfurtransferase [Chloroflexi bacterium]|nr:sulfurtransferase [Chloroflexota bacterium]
MLGMLTLPGPIADVGWLRDHLEHPGLHIADVRWALTGPPGRERYAEGHLPGAIFLDAEKELSSPGEGPGRHPVPTGEKLARILGERGIGDEHAVVAYDDAGGSIAARLWWLFRHYGHGGRCAVLDGGIDAWTDAGLPLSTEVASHAPATWTPRATRDDLVDTATVEASLGGATLLLDARAGERYRGETEPVDPRPGHIPGALSAPWADNLGADGRFRSAGELRGRYAALGVEERPTVVYCGSSLTATHDLLAMELAGIEGASLYEGSWSHWSTDPSRPAATGPEP